MSAEAASRPVAAAVGAALALALAIPSPAAPGELLSISLGGGLAAMPRQWTSTAAFSSWAGWTDTVESAQLQASHDAGAGPAFSVGLGFRLTRRLGLSLAAGRSSRDTTAAIQLSLPHPFLIGRPRTARGDAGSLSYKETSVHVDADWRSTPGRFEIALFAGPSLVRVETQAIDGAQVRDEYPYDAPSFQAAHSVVARSELTLGWNLGASGAWVATRHLDLGLEARYVSATVSLRPSGVLAFELSAGGLQLTARLGLRF